MQFSELSKYFSKLSDTTSRNTMIEILAELFSKIEASEIDKIIYLMQGRVAPLYIATEFGMADKMILKAVSEGLHIDINEVVKIFKQEGDVGKTVEKIKRQKSKGKNESKNLKVSEVFDTLEKIAKTNGSGSVEIKTKLMADLLSNLDSSSACFVARIPIGRMRLGFSDMTVLDSFSWMLANNKSLRPEIERAYNVHPDLGLLGKVLNEKGLKGLGHVGPEVFTPILMARAERLSSGEEIILKIGKCSIEPKIDGFRLQAHYKKSSTYAKASADKQNSVKLITRNLEDATFMYPDLVEAIKKQVKADEVIFEGEAIAYNPDTGEFLPFQETVQRKRKYNIEQMAKEVPLKFILFDLLYLDGENLIHEGFIDRRKKLEKIIGKDDVLMMSSATIVEDPKAVDLLFDDAISRGLEGIMAKKIDGIYRAGSRDWNWIKLKRSYSSSLDDTIDALVMGFNYGKGKRTAFGIGAFLIGVYDKKKDMFVTVSKIGTGLTDDEWIGLAQRCRKLKANEKPPLYEVDRMLEPDVWVEPEIIVEIKADEITRSPIHTAGRVMKASKSGSAFDVDIPGYALRFPRLVRFKDDRKPEDATNLAEIEEMFNNQRKEK